MKKELINERENGFIKADKYKADFSLVDPYAYEDLAGQLTLGAKKYNKDNWKKGTLQDYLSAMERHLTDIKKALEEDSTESLIDDTGLQHGAAIMCNAMFIHYFIRQKIKRNRGIMTTENSNKIDLDFYKKQENKHRLINLLHSVKVNINGVLTKDEQDYYIKEIQFMIDGKRVHNAEILKDIQDGQSEIKL